MRKQLKDLNERLAALEERNNQARITKTQNNAQSIHRLPRTGRPRHGALARAAAGGGAAAEAPVPAAGAAQRARRDPAPGQVDADRARRAAVSRRLEEREGRAHRLRALLRALDVQGLQERRAGAAHLDHRVGRRPGQRLHQRRHDGVLADDAGAVPAAGVVDGSRPHGDPAHRREDLRRPSAKWSRKSGACGSRTRRSGCSTSSSPSTPSTCIPTSTR